MCRLLTLIESVSRSLPQSGRVLRPWVLMAVACVLPVQTGVLSYAAEQPPNVIIILVDDLGYGDLSSYGATDLRTAHIDALVAAGMRFDAFYANCSVCSPTRASLLTGRYPELVGVPGVIRTHAENSWGYLAHDAVLLPSVLRERGYATAMVGKWHLGLAAPNLPNARGYTWFRGYLGDMMDDYYTHRRHGINYMRADTQEIDPQGHATDLFTMWACQYLRENTHKEQPFFLYLAYNAPHDPIQPPDQWLAKVRGREPHISEKRAKLVALIEHLDDGIGHVTATLRETGLSDNTLLFFTSDNGGSLPAGANNGPLRDGKQSMYEGGLRVPACAVWPGKIAPQSQAVGTWMTMDVFATACDAAGVSPSQPTEGQSFLPMLLHGTQDLASRDLYFHRREGGEAYQGLTIAAVRRGNWKLVRNSPFAPLELFNLQDDPREEHDVAATQRQVFRELTAALRRQVQRGGSVPWQEPAAASDPPTPLP